MADAQRVRTITDLARLAGVSPGTVSRALAGSELISLRTRERIQAMANDHGFTPNAMARNLRTKRTGAIGVVIPLGHESSQHVSDPFFMTMLGHLADLLTENRYDLLLMRVVPTDDGWLRRIADSGRVDGIIVIGQSNQLHIINAVAASYRPIVAWGAHGDGVDHCTVGTDNRIGGRLAAQHLIDKGCRHIAFIGNARAPEIADRLIGVRETLQQAGIVAEPDIIYAPFSADEAYTAISEWLASNANVPDGLVAASDVVAMAALRALTDRGLKVPADVRLVGYDDLPLSAHTVPPLTTVHQRIDDGARQLVAQLLRRIGGEDTGGSVLAPALVVRDSA